MSDIDYDKYYVKHCARYYGWLPAIEKYKEELNRGSLKYFTLCARSAIDVFMLEMKGLLLRDESKKLPNVVICENDKGAAIEILNLVRPPLKEAVIQGPLEDILLFQDDEQTKGLSPDAYVKNFRIRERLRIKMLSERLKMFFPFDVINFDPYGNLLDPGLRKNRLYQCLKKIFELQEQISTFLLLLTTPISCVHTDCASRLRADFEANVHRYKKIRDVLLSSLHTIGYDEIEDKKRIAIGFAKSIVLATAKNTGWNCEHQGIYVYQNKHGNRFLSSITKVYRTQSSPDESVYIDDIIRIIKDMPKYYSYKDADTNLEVIKHLEEVKKYREKVRKEGRTKMSRSERPV